MFIAKVAALEVPPPGEGFVTVICAVPTVARSDAGIATCNCVELTNVVECALPFHCTVDDEMKPDPVTVTCTELPPTVADVGEIELSNGAGLLVGVEGALVPPPPQAVRSIMPAHSNVDNETVKYFAVKRIII